ncbi:MAG: toprim domain-containing protein [Candidatus Omnitrophica bacterium]|nr:toprim domain-containing protein [Candidatus Omnitrophota bacterium]
MLNVTYENITHLKKLNLPEILQQKGIHLKRNGNGSYLGLCPFHKDTNPSLSISEKDGIWLWHCFGCHKGGTLIDFLRYYENKSFKDIYSNYSNNKDNLKDKDIQSILNEMIQFYHNSLKEDTSAQSYLKGRGLLDRELIDTFKIGYCNGSAKELLPNDEALKQRLKDLGLLNEKQNESFYKSITVPILDKNDNVVGLYGRNIERKAHLYQKGPHRGIFNHKTLKVHDEIILTEGIIDALSLYKTGFKHVTSSYGTNGFTEHHLKAFKENNVKTIYIAYDNDPTGKKTSQALAKTLIFEGFDVRRINLPEGVKDVNDYFNYNERLDFKGSKETFGVLLKDSKKIGHSLTVKRKDEGLLFYEEGCAFFRYNDTDYEIKGIDKKAIDLRVIIQIRHESARHQDRFDLYSAKSRSVFINQASKRLNLKKEEIDESVLNMIEAIERIKRDESNRKEEGSAPYQMTEEEEKEALGFLKRPGLLERITDDLKDCGYVGEETNKRIAYLIATSRKLKKPLSSIIISQSSSGKSYLMEIIASLMPEEEVEFYSRITPQSLYYMDKDSLRHKLLIIDERLGSEEADYAVRSLQSRHKLTLAYPIKDPNTGKMKTIVVEIEGPVSFIESSTKDKINPENTSRSFQLYLDESEAQTKRIHEYQRFCRGPAGWKLLNNRPGIMKLHKNAQRLLRSIKIIIPFIDEIKFPSRWMRTRRDQDRFLSLIEAVTFLYQYQRPVRVDSRGKPYIESSLKDYETAYNLAHKAFLDTLEDLRGPDKAFCAAIEGAIRERTNNPVESFIFKRRDIREWLKLPDHYIKRKLAILEDLEYVACERSYKGGTSKYRLIPRIDKDDYISNLTSPSQLQKSWTEPGEK